MCTQPIYESKLKLEFKKNLEEINESINKANKILKKNILNKKPKKT